MRIRYALFAVAVFSSVTFAGSKVKKDPQFPTYSVTNISYLTGSTYTLGDPHKNTLRFDHASSWEYGDNFFFFDLTSPFAKGASSYGEWVTRLSFGKLIGHPIRFAFIDDVLFAGEIDLSGQDSRAYLFGPSVNLKIPGFKYFQVYLYRRRDAAKPGSTYQVTWAWNLPFHVISKRVLFLFSGFCDYAGKQSTLAENFLAKPQLLLDLGNLAFHKKDKLLAGLRYVYWKNKYGIKGVTESVPEFMLTWRIA